MIHQSTIFFRFPCTTLFRSHRLAERRRRLQSGNLEQHPVGAQQLGFHKTELLRPNGVRSEEHTSELQSRPHIVCRLLLEKKNSQNYENLDWSYVQKRMLTFV